MSCECVPGSTTSCDRYLGCMCTTGWSGRHCHIDLVPPTFDGCPQEITKVIRDEETDTNVTWQVPTVSDNSDNVIVQNNYAPGSVFHIGTTEVKYTAIDSANNTDTCQFKVNVMNHEELRVSVVVLSVIACLVFIIPLCVYLGYRYRLQLYLLLRVEVDDFDDGGDKDYDAFVLYSSKDGDFAEDIMKRLERNGKYKLLLHHRNFIAGKSVLDNIEDSFDNSRAAILVISPNFLESSTCEHEARIALDNWINRRQKLIPIVKGNIEQANHSQIIKRIVKFITYIPWPENGSPKEEDRFWIELENALEKRVQKNSGIDLFRRALVSLSRCCGRVYSRVPNHVV
ncbi:toll-like receptor 4 [Ptychodera flava]|uniref:toll-like receptor 4 n=1 Tax=Ptychodera flava TaxID=63121 RepID=UPI003969FE59